jgi:hypothetical protein
MVSSLLTYYELAKPVDSDFKPVPLLGGRNTWNNPWFAAPVTVRWNQSREEIEN